MHTQSTVRQLSAAVSADDKAVRDALAPLLTWYGISWEQLWVQRRTPDVCQRRWVAFGVLAQRGYNTSQIAAISGLHWSSVQHGLGRCAADNALSDLASDLAILDPWRMIRTMLPRIGVSPVGCIAAYLRYLVGGGKPLLSSISGLQELGEFPALRASVERVLSSAGQGSQIWRMQWQAKKWGVRWKR